MGRREAAPSGGQDALIALIQAKALAELGDAAGLLGSPRPWRGEPFSALAFVVSGLSEEAGAAEPLRGAPGEAADKAAAALGVDPANVFVVASRRGGASDEERSHGLALAIEAADPRVVIALDGLAAADLAAAFGAEPMDVGVPVRALGRVLGWAGEFAESLAGTAAKAPVWNAMKTIAAEGGLQAKSSPKVRRGGPSDPAQPDG